MDDAIGHASGEQNSHTTVLGAGSVGNAGCSFTGPFRGFEDENVSGPTVIYPNKFVSLENASTTIMFNHAGYDASQNWAHTATPSYTEKRATPEFIPNAFSYANPQGNIAGQFMPTYTAAQCVPPCNTVGIMPPNNAPISVHPNGAEGFIPPANGLGFVPKRHFKN